MPDNIEKILRAIHILLSNSESYNGSETEVIVDKKKIFKELEKLNYAVMEVMETYEVNELSKEKAINRVQKDAQKIIDDASKSAEEIYAAALIYTDDALNELRDVMNKTRAAMNKEYNKIFGKMDSQIELIGKNRDELHMQLADLSSGNEYLNIIVDEKKRREKEKERYNKVSDKAPAVEPVKERDKGSSDVVINVNTSHPAFKKSSVEGEEISSEDMPPEKDGVYKASDFDLDGEYFKWQEGSEKPEIKEDVDIKGTFLGRFFKKDE
ncbi:MAG: hypothetical protein E7241_06500 [Lachnospiraceae bacterium]|nr:hypothetical protein [Lachnospiraceae bacterium]